MTWLPDSKRYDTMVYRRCGRSGLLLPAISLGLWQNFGASRPLENSRAILRRAFDLGITHFDLANNYGPPYGSAEESFGRILPAISRASGTSSSSRPRRATTCGRGRMASGGSRKYLLASLDQSLRRMGLDYVDIFYSHRFDPEHAARRDDGCAGHRRAPRKGPLRRYLLLLRRPYPRSGGHPARHGHQNSHPPAVVLSVQPLDRARPARCARRRGHRLHSLLAVWRRVLLTDRYLDGVPEGSRASANGSLQPGHAQRGQSGQGPGVGGDRRPAGASKLSQLALAWALRDPRVTSALIGVSSVAQLESNVTALENLEFTTRNWPRSTATRRRPGSTSGHAPARSNRA